MILKTAGPEGSAVLLAKGRDRAAQRLLSREFSTGLSGRNRVRIVEVEFPIFLPACFGITLTRFRPRIRGIGETAGDLGGDRPRAGDKQTSGGWRIP